MDTPRQGNASNTIGDEASKATSLEDPALYINRELSWIKFNERVLEEAEDHMHPLLERVKFLAICGSNLDEFFMTRAYHLEEQVDRNQFEPTPDGMTPLQQIEITRKEILPLLVKHAKCWEESLCPSLRMEGVRVQSFSELDATKKQALRDYLKNVMLPVMNKKGIDAASSFIPNLHIHLLILGKFPEKSETYLALEMPVDEFGRLIQLPKGAETSAEGHREVELVFIEDLIESNLDLLFPPEFKILGKCQFRVTRNAEIDVKVDESTDFLRTMELSMEQRRHGKPSRLEYESSAPSFLKEYLSNMIGLPEYAQYVCDCPLGLSDLWQLLKVDRPDLKDAPLKAFVVPELAPGSNSFEAISRKDFALYHPYDSFDMITNLFREAAMDINVTDIYITLYRIDPTSPIIGALLAAAFNGKSVTALIELKAKFDEVNNINWAKVLGQAGVNVVYNFPKVKVHAKLGLILRREGGRLVQYSHIGSGNYNAVTTRIYGDIGYLTANPQIGAELLDLFHSLTGETRKMEKYQYLLVSPQSLRNEILGRIAREVQMHNMKGGGYLAFKLNALVDKSIIQALYRASMAGVKIDLNVRGLCCLRPGLPGVSENIRVISIVGRFLEHARIYYFRNGGEEEVLLGSSDMMPRNLERRVEVLFSVPDPKISVSIFRNILSIHLRDNVKARRLLPDGTYEKVTPLDGEETINSQLWLIDNRGVWHGTPADGSS
jgi:polyphosphate kinase